MKYGFFSAAITVEGKSPGRVISIIGKTREDLVAMVDSDELANLEEVAPSDVALSSLLCDRLRAGETKATSAIGFVPDQFHHLRKEVFYRFRSGHEISHAFDSSTKVHAFFDGDDKATFLVSEERARAWGVGSTEIQGLITSAGILHMSTQEGIKEAQEAMPGLVWSTDLTADKAFVIQGIADGYMVAVCDTRPIYEGVPQFVAFLYKVGEKKPLVEARRNHVPLALGDLQRQIKRLKDLGFDAPDSLLQDEATGLFEDE